MAKTGEGVNLKWMRMIRHLKIIGLALKQIKEILGGMYNQRTLMQILLSLHIELLNEKKIFKIKY